mmetsp:Transcript_45911/g.109349  ORF Transcript_45911/g.109349 Transcript_45911/m.109349 type:complete len:151 (-) Transcript_45911:132-584(-)
MVTAVEPGNATTRSQTRKVSFGEVDIYSVSPRQPENEELQFERALAELDLDLKHDAQDVKAQPHGHDEDARSAEELERAVVQKLFLKEAKTHQRGDRWSISARNGESRPLPSISKSALWARRSLTAAASPGDKMEDRRTHCQVSELRPLQ